MHMNLKTAVVVLGLTLCAGSAFANNLKMNTQEARLRGWVDFETPSGTEFFAEALYGIFYQDNLEWGPTVLVEFNDDITMLNVGGFIEYNWPNDMSYLIPYVGSGMGIAYTDIDGGSSETAVTFYLEGGSKLFIDQALNTALTMSARFSAASEDVYPSEDGADSIDFSLLFGISSFFD